eukprot:456000-Alexandrium_andersonii.AAC.1
MSASLVGSEMCIRDRFWGCPRVASSAFHPRLFYPDGPLDHAVPPQALPAPPPCHTCLLRRGAA